MDSLTAEYVEAMNEMVESTGHVGNPGFDRLHVSHGEVPDRAWDAHAYVREADAWGDPA
jgi:hypothetical protein